MDQRVWAFLRSGLSGGEPFPERIAEETRPNRGTVVS